VSGYEDKIGVLLESIIDTLLNFSCTPARFETLKDKYERLLKNFKDEEPRIQAYWYMSHLLSQFSWTHQDLLRALAGK
jgi:insulysin